MLQTKNILIMATLAIVGALTVGCTNDDNIITDENPAAARTVILTTTIGFDASPAGEGAEGTTRALDADGKKTFTKGEKVAVIYSKTDKAKYKAEYTIQKTDIHSGGKGADLTFTLTDPLDGNSDVTFIYPASMADPSVYQDYFSITALERNQDGTFGKLSSDFDIATATSNMTVSGGKATLSEHIVLTNPLCIGKFTIKDGTAPINNKITELNVTAGNYNYTVKRTASSDPIYIAMKPVQDSKVTVTYKDGSDYYSKTVTKTLGANNIYPVNVTLTKINPREIPLTLRAITSGYLNVTINTYPNPGSPVKYSLNGKVQDEGFPSGTKSIYVYAGSEICFYGNNSAYVRFDGTNTYKSNIIFSGSSFIYGNIMSLVKGLDSDDKITNAFVSATDLTSDYTFQNLFKGNEYMRNHSLPLVLPATTLTQECYRGMFHGCRRLTKAPELPTIALQDGCYQEMFAECVSLSEPPVLPATEMKTNCYRVMFRKCEKLTKAPDLPATTLANSCYMYMFTECTGLTTASVLPAKTLTDYCYDSMFNGCTNLSSVTCLATDISADHCLNDWLKDAGKDASERKLHVINGQTGAGWDWKVPTDTYPWTVVDDQISTP